MYVMAVCDDEREVARWGASRLRNIFGNMGYETEIHSYTDPGELKRQIDNGIEFDALFLDIDMPGMDGIELCRYIRKSNNNCLVVFVSNKEELVFQVFEVMPFRFVRKNHFSAEIDKVCKDLLTELQRREDVMIHIKNESDSEIYSINVNRVMYIEAEGKNCSIYLENKKVTVRRSFSDLVEKMKEYHFLQIHRSYIVNPHFIYRIGNTSVTLDNSSELPLSRNRRDPVREEFFNWRREMM